jgi:hypothetical protein
VSDLVQSGVLFTDGCVCWTRLQELRQRIREIEEAQEHVRSKNTRFSKVTATVLMEAS